MNLAVFASGNGSNFAAIAKAIKQKKIKVNKLILICDQPQAYVLKRAQKANVKIILIRREDFVSKSDFEEAIRERLKAYKINFIVLAGYMRILSPSFVRAYRHRIINIHPSLLPDFKGAHAISDAFKRKAEITGVTVHFVDEQVDHGPVILQHQVKIKNTDTLSSLESRIHRVEHKIYPEAINLWIKRKV